jgi:hypothetical protein
MKNGVGSIRERMIAGIAVMLFDSFTDAGGATMRTFEVPSSIPTEVVEETGRIFLYVLNVESHGSVINLFLKIRINLLITTRLIKKVYAKCLIIANRFI